MERKLQRTLKTNSYNENDKAHLIKFDPCAVYPKQKNHPEEDSCYKLRRSKIGKTMRVFSESQKRGKILEARSKQLYE